MTARDIKKLLPRSTPESQGVASSALLALVETLDSTIHELHSLMLIRHGRVIAEGWWLPYAPPLRHMLYSLSKSFTSTAAGMAIEEGRFSLDDPVLSFFASDAPSSVSENLAAMRVRHLLSMSTGHAEDTLGYLHRRSDGDWVKAFLSRPIEHTPGSHFLYNSGATYMVSAIVQKVTGLTLLKYLRPRLFEPLGIEDPTWESCPRGINTGGWGLSIRTEDIAKFGQLYLQRGMWKGRRLITESWVDEATSYQVSNGDNPDSDWAQGYGYQFWRCRHNAYRGDGAFGQYCVVMPDQDAVLAITAGLGDMQAPLNVVWQQLIPAFKDEPLPENSQDQEKLRHVLSGLTVKHPEGSAESPTAAAVSGKLYRFPLNQQGIESIAFQAGRHENVLHIGYSRGEDTVRCGCGKNAGVWIRGKSTLQNGEPQPVAASGAWREDDTYVVKLCFYETPYCPTITLHFKDEALTFDYSSNVAFGPVERPQIVGKLLADA